MGHHLLKHSPAGPVTHASSVCVNTAFAPPKMKLSLLSVGVAVRNEAREREADRELQIDRRHNIQASIMRVMKARRTLKHSNLIEEVSSQVAKYFSASALDIKAEIEALIEREDLRRSELDHQVYEYMA